MLIPDASCNRAHERNLLETPGLAMVGGIKDLQQSRETGRPIKRARTAGGIPLPGSPLTRTQRLEP